MRKIILGDCLQKMRSIETGSVDMILTDLPYGTTACKWDSVLNLDKLWSEYNRVIRTGACIALTASQPFTSALVLSNINNFKYEWIWEKSKASNFLLARKQPLKAHESILIFSNGTTVYRPQMTNGKPFKGEGRSKKGSNWDGVNHVPNGTYRNDNNGTRYPGSVQYFKTAESEKVGALHTAQKPVALFEYLIKTYTDENQLVLDSCAGSFTTAIACINTNRSYICIEKERNYYEIGKQRIKNHLAKRKQEV